MSNLLQNQKQSPLALTNRLKGADQHCREPIAVTTKLHNVPALIENGVNPKASILLIDDEAGIRTLLGNALATQGYPFEEASNGLIGLALFQEMQPDLILLDISMAGMDGFAVLDEIRRQNTIVGVIMVSALKPERLAGRAMANGVDGYIQKPFRAQTLFQEIERVSTLVYSRRYHATGQHKFN